MTSGHTKGSISFGMERILTLESEIQEIVKRLRREQARRPRIDFEFRLMGWAASRLENASEELEKAAELLQRLEERLPQRGLAI